MPINHIHLFICILILHSVKDSHKDNNMPNNKTQEVILILHHRLVPFLNSYFTADRWKTNTHFDLLVHKGDAQQNVLRYRPTKISLFLNWMRYPSYRNLHSHMKALSMQVNISKFLEAASSLGGETSQHGSVESNTWPYSF